MHDFLLGSRSFIHQKEKKIYSKLYKKYKISKTIECIRVIRIDREGFGNTKQNIEIKNYNDYVSSFFVPLIDKFFLKTSKYKNFSLIGFGGGVPFSLAIAASKEIGNRVDTLITINALNKLNEKQLEKTDFCLSHKLFYKLNNFFKKYEITKKWYTFAFKFFAQFGFLTSKYFWNFNLYHCFSDKDRSKIFNEYDELYLHQQKLEKEKEEKTIDEEEKKILKKNGKI